jgi:hypothetical protein
VFEGLAAIDWLVIAAAAAFGFGVVRFIIVSSRDRSIETSAPPVGPPSDPASDFQSSETSAAASVPTLMAQVPSGPTLDRLPEIPASPPRRPWHDVLEVPADASLDQVQAAYQRKWRKYDPSYFRGLGADAETVATQARLEVGRAFDDFLCQMSADANVSERSSPDIR